MTVPEFRIGALEVHPYGLFLCLGIVVCYLYGLSQARKHGMQSREFVDMVFWTFCSVLFGAKLFHVLFHFPLYADGPLRLIFEPSGFSFIGGALSGFPVLYLRSRHYGVNFLKFMDWLIPGLALGHAIMKTGCFFAGCCFGNPTESCIGVLYPADSPAGILNQKVVPAQLIYVFFLCVLFIFLRWKNKLKKYDGEVFHLYVLIHSQFIIFHGFILYQETRVLRYFSHNQLIAVFLSVAGFAFYIKGRKEAGRVRDEVINDFL